MRRPSGEKLGQLPMPRSRAGPRAARSISNRWERSQSVCGVASKRRRLPSPDQHGEPQ